MLADVRRDRDGRRPQALDCRIASASPSPLASTSARPYPSATNRSAHANPRPFAAPVMMATRPIIRSPSRRPGPSFESGPSAADVARSDPSRRRVRSICLFQSARTMSMRASGASAALNVSTSVDPAAPADRSMSIITSPGRVDGQLGAARRAQADEVQPRRPARRQDATGDVERHAVLAPDQASVEEGQGRLEARRPDDRVDWSGACRRRTRPRCRRTAARPGAGPDPAVLVPVQDQAVHDRPLVVEALATGLAGRTASGRPTDIQIRRRQHGIEQPRRQPMIGSVAARLAEEGLRLEQVALADAQDHRRSRPGSSSDGDVAAGVARPDDQHPPAFDVAGSCTRPSAAACLERPDVRDWKAPSCGRWPRPPLRTGRGPIRRRESQPSKAPGPIRSSRSTRVPNVTCGRGRTGRMAFEVFAHLRPTGEVGTPPASGRR